MPTYPLLGKNGRPITVYFYADDRHIGSTTSRRQAYIKRLMKAYIVAYLYNDRAEEVRTDYTDAYRKGC